MIVGANLRVAGKLKRRRGGRVAPGQQIMQRRTERIQVRTDLNLFEILFGRRVTLGADHRRRTLRLEVTRDAEVHHLDPTVGFHITFDGFKSREMIGGVRQ